jgi:hypothetical protein
MPIIGNRLKRFALHFYYDLPLKWIKRKVVIFVNGNSTTNITVERIRKYILLPGSHFTIALSSPSSLAVCCSLGLPHNMSLGRNAHQNFMKPFMIVDKSAN